MVKPIVKDILFLGQKSEPATPMDIGIMQDTLTANRERITGHKSGTKMRAKSDELNENFF